MNKEELLKAIEQKRQAIWPSDTHEMAPATVPNNLEQGWLNALRWMVSLIKSLPDEQQPSEDLEEYYTKDFLPKEWFAKQGQRTLSEFNFFTASHFAQWQKEQIMKSAIDAIITSRWKDSHVCLTTNKDIPQIYNGDRVKILIIKEDEQCSTE